MNEPYWAEYLERDLRLDAVVEQPSSETDSYSRSATTPAPAAPSGSIQPIESSLQEGSGLLSGDSLNSRAEHRGRAGRRHARRGSGAGVESAVAGKAPVRYIDTQHVSQLTPRAATSSAPGKSRVSENPPTTPHDYEHVSRSRAGLGRGHKVAAATRFLGTVAVPVIAIYIITVYAAVLDICNGPGRGSGKVVTMWIMWPIIATIDYDRVAVPWLGVQLAYIVWVLALNATISGLGGAWPFGRADLDVLPEEHRHSFTSPLGLNAVGQAGFLISLWCFETVNILPALSLDTTYLRWRVEVAERELVESRVRAAEQQRAIVNTVVSQVPKFAYDCMNQGITAFETKPVVMAVRISGRPDEPTPVPNAGLPDRPKTSGGAGGGAACPIAGRSGLDTVDGGGFVGRMPLEAICEHMDRQVSMGCTNSSLAGQAAANGSRASHQRPFIPMLKLLLYRCTSGRYSDAPTGLAASSIGVLSRQQQAKLRWLCQFPSGAVPSSTTVDKIHAGVSLAVPIDASPIGGGASVSSAPQLSSGRESAQWTGAVGMRTPTRRCPDVDHRSRRHLTSLSCLHGIKAVLDAASSSFTLDGTCLSAGLSCPTSSQSSMAVGLLGLQQQPQEWHAFGGGRLHASQLAAYAQACSEANVGWAATCTICLSRRSLDRLEDTLLTLRDAIEAAYQWYLAMASGQDPERQHEVSWGIAGSYSKAVVLATAAVLGRTRKAKQGLDLVLSWLYSCSDATMPYVSGVQESSNDAGLQFSNNPATRQPQTGFNQSTSERYVVLQADVGKLNGTHLHAGPCDRIHAHSGSGMRPQSASMDISQADARSLIAAIQHAMELLSSNEPRAAAAAAATYSELAAEHSAPKWATAVLVSLMKSPKAGAADERPDASAAAGRPKALREESIPQPPEALATSHAALINAPVTSLGAWSAIVLPKRMLDRSNWGGKSDRRSKDYLGLALKSPIIACMQGIGIWIDICFSIYSLFNLECTQHPDQPPSFGRVLVIFLPSLLSSSLVVGWSSSALYQGQEMQLKESMTLFAIYLLGHMVYNLLLRFNVVLRTCTSAAIVLMNNSTTLSSMLLASGVLVLYGTNLASVAIVVLIGLCSGNGLYRGIVSVFARLGAATDLESIGYECDRVFPPDNVTADVLGSIDLIIDVAYVLSFAIIQYFSGMVVFVQLQRMNRIVAEARAVQQQSKNSLERAAATLMPRRVLIAYTNDPRSSEVGRRYHGVSSSHAGRSQPPALYAGSTDTASVSNGQISLGNGLVATLCLPGFDRVSNIAGPLATLALFRRIGQAADAVCAIYGALRVGQGESMMQLGWFASQQPDYSGDKDEAVPAQLRLRGVLGACELARRAREHLREMQVGLGVSVGVSCGAVGVTMVGQHPTTLAFQDRVPVSVGHGPLSYSKRLSKLVPVRGREWGLSLSREGTVTVSEDCVAGLAPACPWLSKFLIDPRSRPERFYGLDFTQDNCSVVEWECVLGLAELFGMLPGTRPQQHVLASKTRSILIHVSNLEPLRLNNNSSTVPVAFFEQPEPAIAGIDWVARLMEATRGSTFFAECEDDNTEEEHTTSSRTSMAAEFHGTGIEEWLVSWTAVAAGRAPESRLTGPLPCRDVDVGIHGMLVRLAAFVIPPASSIWSSSTQPQNAKSLVLHATLVHRSDSMGCQRLMQRKSPMSPVSSIRPSSPPDTYRVAKPPTVALSSNPLSMNAMHMQISDFKWLKLLGEGGFARVYAAVHRHTGRRVALKVSAKSSTSYNQAADKPSGSYSAGNSSRYASLRADVVRNEVVALARCSTSNVPGPCQIQGLVVSEQGVGLVLERVSGCSLRDAVRGKSGRWRVSENNVRPLARQLACTLAKLHAAGVLHRDLKPSNMLLDDDGTVRLVDFGLAADLSSSRKKQPFALPGFDDVLPAAPHPGMPSHRVGEEVSDRDDEARPSRGWVAEDLQGHDEVGLGLPLLLPAGKDAMCCGGSKPYLFKVSSMPVSVLLVGHAVARGKPKHRVYTESFDAICKYFGEFAGPEKKMELTTAQSLSAARVLLHQEPLLYDCVVVCDLTDRAGQSTASAASSGDHDHVLRRHAPNDRSRLVSAIWKAGSIAAKRMLKTVGLPQIAENVAAMVPQAFTLQADTTSLPSVDAVRDMLDQIVEVGRHRDGTIPRLLRQKRPEDAVVPAASRSDETDPPTAAVYTVYDSASLPSLPATGLRPSRESSSRSAAAQRPEQGGALPQVLTSGKLRSPSVTDGERKPANAPSTGQARTGGNLHRTRVHVAEVQVANSDDSTNHGEFSSVASKTSTIVANQPGTDIKRTVDYIYREKQPFVAGIAGTPLFMAPELFQHQGQRASDYWSMGVTLFWLLSGRMPFGGISGKQYLAAARKGDISWHLLPGCLSPACIDLLRGLLEPNASYRYDAGVLACHPFLAPKDEGTFEQVLKVGRDGHRRLRRSRYWAADHEEILDELVLARWTVDDPFVHADEGCDAEHEPAAQAQGGSNGGVQVVRGQEVTAEGCAEKASALVNHAGLELLPVAPMTESLGSSVYRKVSSASASGSAVSGHAIVLDATHRPGHQAVKSRSKKQRSYRRAREKIEQTAKEAAILEIYCHRVGIRMQWKLAAFARPRCIGADAVEEAAVRDLNAMGYDRDSIRVAILRQNHKMQVSAEEFAGWDDGVGGIGALDAAVSLASGSGSGRSGEHSGGYSTTTEQQDGEIDQESSGLGAGDEELGGGVAGVLGEEGKSRVHYGFASLPSVIEARESEIEEGAAGSTTSQIDSDDL